MRQGLWPGTTEAHRTIGAWIPQTPCGLTPSILALATRLIVAGLVSRIPLHGQADATMGGFEIMWFDYPQARYRRRSFQRFRPITVAFLQPTTILLIAVRRINLYKM